MKKASDTKGKKATEPQKYAAKGDWVVRDPDARRAAMKARARAAHDAISDEEDARITAAAKADPDTVDPDKVLKRIGRPPAAVTKEKVMLRLDPEVLAAFRATGAGWQTRMNDVLRKAAGLKAKV